MLPTQFPKAERNDIQTPTKFCVPKTKSFLIRYWKLLLVIICIIFIQIYHEFEFQFNYESTTNTIPNLDITTEPSTHIKLCLYDTNNSLNKSLLSMNIGSNGYWTNLTHKSCINNGNIYCVGSLSTLYDSYTDNYAIYRYNKQCVYHIYDILDEKLLQCLSNKAILFLGDSTMEYMVYYSLLNHLLNVSIFEDEEHILREYEFSQSGFKGKYNISIYFRYASGWPSIYNNHGTTTFSHGRLWAYIDKRFLHFGNITHIIFHSLFHDITHRTVYEQQTNHRNVSLSEHVEQYKQRLVKIYIGLLERIAIKAKENIDLDDDDYGLYIWPSTHPGNEGDKKGLVFLLGHKGYFEWFNAYYDVYLNGMIEAINDAVELRPIYKQHLIFVDTSSMSKGHRHMYYGDGLHYGSGEQRDGVKRSPVVRDMMNNAILNEICLRKTHA